MNQPLHVETTITSTWVLPDDRGNAAPVQVPPIVIRTLDSDTLVAAEAQIREQIRQVAASRVDGAEANGQASRPPSPPPSSGDADRVPRRKRGRGLLNPVLEGAAPDPDPVLNGASETP